MEDPKWVATSGDLEDNFKEVENGEALVLPSGMRMMIYLFGLDHLSTSDIGVTVGVVVFTANAQYHKETNVEAGIPS